MKTKTNIKQKILLGAALALMAPMAQAQTGVVAGYANCRFGTDIVNMADRILLLRPEIDNQRVAALFGGDALHLALHYKDGFVEQALDIFNWVETSAETPPQNLLELKLVYLIAALGWEDGLARAGVEPLDAFMLLSPAIFRAILQKAGIPTFLDLLAQAKALPDPDQRFSFGFQGGQWVPLAVMDQDDAFKLNFAELAEAGGHISTAGFLLSARQDLEAYKAFLQRNQNDAGLFSNEAAVQYSYVLMSQTQPTELTRTLEPATRAEQQAIFDINRAGFRSKKLILFNYNAALASSGYTDEIAAVARAYLAALETGALSERDIEAGWLLQYRGLVAAIGQQEADRVFQRVGSLQARHYEDRPFRLIQWALAKEAIAPYLRGETDELPARPALLGERLNFEGFSKLAAAARIWQEVPPLADVEELPVRSLIEIFYLQGRFDMVHDVIEPYFAPKEAVEIYQDLMLRLDLRCDGYTDFPGASALLWRSLYRFTPRDSDGG